MIFIRIINYFINNFNPALNVPIMLIIGIVVFVGSYNIEKRTSANDWEIIRKAAINSLLAIYAYFIIAVTIVNRTVTNEPEVEWIPFWSWYQIITGNRALWFLEEITLNILLFVPLGCLIGVIWKINALKAFIIGLGSSIIIEVAQLILCRGLFQWDDMLHNAFGCMLGAIIVNVIRKLERRKS